MVIKFEAEFEINQEVYHKLAEGRKGIITDIRYNHDGRRLLYLVVFGILGEEEVLCKEVELSKTICF